MLDLFAQKLVINETHKNTHSITALLEQKIFSLDKFTPPSYDVKKQFYNYFSSSAGMAGSHFLFVQYVALSTIFRFRVNEERNDEYYVFVEAATSHPFFHPLCDSTKQSLY